MNKTKIYDVVYKQIVYLMYTSRSFGLQSRDNSVRRAIRNSTLIKISNVIAYSIAIMVVGIISAFTKNAPLSLIFMDLIIFANIITTGLNIMFFVSNSDLKTFLLSLPLNDKEVSFAIIRGIFEFFYYGFLISIIFTPIIVFFSTLSVLQAIMSELEIIFVFSISFALMIIVGKRIKLGIASTLFRVGTSLFWVLFIIFPYGFTFRNYSLPYYLLPIFPFAFFNILGIILSITYVILSLLLTYRQIYKLLDYNIITSHNVKYKIRLQSPFITYLYKDLKGLLRVPQASFLLTIPAFALFFSFFAPTIAIYYVIFMITTSSIGLILLEASGLQLLITLPSGLKSSFLSKLTIVALIYLISIIIFSAFGKGLESLIMLPSLLASVELSLIISYNNVIKGKGVRIGDPISLLIREIEINSIVIVSIILLHFNPIYSIIFSSMMLVLMSIIAFKKIT